MCAQGRRAKWVRACASVWAGSSSRWRARGTRRGVCPTPCSPRCVAVVRAACGPSCLTRAWNISRVQCSLPVSLQASLHSPSRVGIEGWPHVIATAVCPCSHPTHAVHPAASPTPPIHQPARGGYISHGPSPHLSPSDSLLSRNLFAAPSHLDRLSTTTMSTVAAQVVFHPVVSQSLKTWSTTLGRDKVRTSGIP